jgi:peptidyl-dipeptidase Dcp
VEKEMAPKLAEFSDKIHQNEALFKRIEAVYNGDKSTSDARAAAIVVVVLHYNFVRAGAKLGAEAKAREYLRSTRSWRALFTKFSQNILEDETDDYVVLTDAK